MDKNDVCVLLKPVVKDKKWTGDVSIGVLSTNSMDLDREDQIDLLKLGRRVCALIPMMMEDKELERDAEKIARDYMPMDTLLTDDLKIDANIILVNFEEKRK